MTVKDWSRILLRRVTANAWVRTPLRDLAQAGFLPEGIWKRLPVELTFQIRLPDGRSFSYSAIANDVISRALFWRGLKSWEPKTIQVFYKLAQRSGLVLDIGANTGIFTLLTCAANSNARVVCFEPVPRTFKKLLENIKINGWEDHCQPHCEAVSNSVGSTQFHVPFGDLPTSASLHSQGFRGYKGVLIDVPITTIDTVCSEDERVDLVKIDVEGFEDKVLEGMQRVLATSTPDIIVECLSDGSFRSVETILAKFGYHFFHIRREGLVTVDKIVPSETGCYPNFLCTIQDDLGL